MGAHKRIEYAGLTTVNDYDEYPQREYSNKVHHIHQLHYDVTCNYTHAENIHNSHLPLLNLRTEFAYMLPRSDPRAMFGLPQASNVINIRNQKQCPSAAR